MNFDTGDIPALLRSRPEVGDVYRAKGGRGETRFWLIVCITNQTAHALGLNAEGEIVSTTSYGLHVFAERWRAGRCADIAELRLSIEWDPE